jgi:four helix bundle protein
MSQIRTFRDHTWQAAMRLAVHVYSIAKQLPATERFELAAQMRRAAVSVPSNVAEGQAFGRGGRSRHHVRIALGSWAELASHLELVKSPRLLEPSRLVELEAQLDKTGQLLHGLLRSLRVEAVAKAGLAILLFAYSSVSLFT